MAYRLMACIVRVHTRRSDPYLVFLFIFVVNTVLYKIVLIGVIKQYLIVRYTVQKLKLQGYCSKGFTE